MARRGKAETEVRTLITGEDKSKRAFNSLNKSLKNTASTLQVVQGPLGPVAGRFTALASIIGRVSPVTIGFTAAFVAATVAVKKGLTVLSKTESQLGQLDAQLKATGFSAGKTADELEALAQSVAQATLASLQEVRTAEGILLSFRSITEETFDGALTAAQDLAAAGFGSITDAAKQLGKALEDPATGLSSLRRAGVTFSQSQKDVIKQLVETGDKAKAMQMILEGINAQVGGAGAGAAGGIAGKFDSLSQSIENFWSILGDRSNASLFGVAIGNIGESVDWLAGKLETFDHQVRTMTLTEALKKQAQLARDITNAEPGFFSGPDTKQLELEKAAIDARVRAIRLEQEFATASGKVAAKALADDAASLALKDRQLAAEKAIAQWQKEASKDLQKNVAAEQARTENLDAILNRLEPIRGINQQFLKDQKAINAQDEDQLDIKRQLLMLDDERAKAIDEIINKEQVLTESQERVRDTADDLARIMGDGFKAATLEGKKFGDVVGDVLKRIASQLVEVLIIQKSVAAISGALQGNTFFSGLTGGAGAGVKPGVAGGGSIASSGVRMVGESGPEMQFMSKGSRVIPNKDLGGGGDVNIQVVNNTTPQVEVSTQTERQPDGNAMIRFIIDTVADDVGRGGNVSRAMQSSFGARQKAVTR